MTDQLRIEQVRVSEIKENPLNEEIFNAISKEKYAALREYIKSRGLLKPLILNPDKVLLAGHVRFSICKELGYETVTCQYVDFESSGKEEEFLIKDNILTRILSPIEIAKAGIHLEHVSKKYERRGEPLRDLVARTLGVSHETYRCMKEIVKSGDEDLIAKVDSGQLSVSKAHILLKSEKQKAELKKAASTEKPRFRLINEDPLSALSNFRPASCDLIVAEPPANYNGIWVDMAHRALKETGSLFILTQRNLSVISATIDAGFTLVVPICVLGRTHQDGNFVFNHRTLAWMSKGSKYRVQGRQKISTVWDFKAVADVMLEIFTRILNLTTVEADIVVHLFGDNRSILELSQSMGRNIFAIQPDRDVFIKEKLQV